MSKDDIVWRYDKKGFFSVKSAYHLAISLNSSDKTSPTNSSHIKRFWKRIWNLDVPRVKINAWKIIKDIIPTKENIQKKGIDLNHFVCNLQKQERIHSPFQLGMQAGKRSLAKLCPFLMELVFVVQG